MALKHDQKRRIEDGFVTWRIFVEKQKNLSFVACLIQDRLKERIMSRYFGIYLEETKKIIDLKNSLGAISHEINYKVAFRAIHLMSKNAKLIKEDRKNNQKADFLMKSKVFSQFRQCVDYLRQEKNREKVGMEISSSFFKKTLLHKFLNSISLSIKITREREEEAHIVREVKLISQGLRSLSMWARKKNVDVPVYSRRQIFLGYKYLGMLTGREGKEEQVRETSMSRVEMREQISEDSAGDLIPQMGMKNKERMIQGKVEESESEHGRSEEDSENMDDFGEISPEKREEYVKMNHSETSRPGIEDILGPASNTSARADSKRFQNIYELPAMTERCNLGKVKRANLSLNHLILDRLFSHWKNRVASKETFKRSIALRLLQKSFVSFKQYTTQESIERYNESLASTFQSKRLLSASFAGLVLAYKKFGPLFRNQKHFELERNINLISKYYKLFKHQYEDSRRLKGLYEDAGWKYAHKHKSMCFQRLIQWKERLQVMRCKEEAIHYINKKRIFKEVVQGWVRMIPEEGKTTRKENLVRKQADRKALNQAFKGWLEFISEIKLNKERVINFRERSEKLLMSSIFTSMKNILCSIGRGRKFGVFIANLPRRKLQAKTFFSLKSNGEYEKDKKRFAMENIPKIEDISRRSVVFI